MQRFDVIVVGAGVAGSASAYRLAGQARVLLLERHALPHALGSSHGASRIFRHAYEDVRYVRLAQAAGQAWRWLERDSGERLLRTTGGIDIAAAGAPALRRIEAALRQAGSPVERLDAAELSARFPAMRPDPAEEALFQRSAGVLDADRALLAMRRTALSRGVTLREREPVESLRVADGAVELRTSAGRYSAGRVVLTAGPWLGELLPALAGRLRVERQQVLYLPVASPERFAPGRFPVFIHREVGVYGFPRLERAGAIKVSDHSGAPTIALSERDFALHEARASRTVESVRRFLPDAGPSWVDYQTCLYTKTPDEGFLLGPHPEHPEVIVGGGFSGHGFKFGPLLGEILADLALSGSSPRDLSAFRLDRPALGGPAGGADGGAKQATGEPGAAG